MRGLAQVAFTSAAGRGPGQFDGTQPFWYFDAHMSVFGRVFASPASPSFTAYWWWYHATSGEAVRAR